MLGRLWRTDVAIHDDRSNLFRGMIYVTTCPHIHTYTQTYTRARIAYTRNRPLFNTAPRRAALHCLHPCSHSRTKKVPLSARYSALHCTRISRSRRYRLHDFALPPSVAASLLHPDLFVSPFTVGQSDCRAPLVIFEENLHLPPVLPVLMNTKSPKLQEIVRPRKKLFRITRMTRRRRESVQYLFTSVTSQWKNRSLRILVLSSTRARDSRNGFTI